VLETPNIDEYLIGDTQLPVPDWDRVGEWVELYVPPEDQYRVWTELALQWLHLINERFRDGYHILETEHFLIFGDRAQFSLNFLGRFAEATRRSLLRSLPGLGKFTTPGKTPILIFSGNEAYYTHVSDYHGDGEYGGSAGMHIRTTYDHIALLHLHQADIHTALVHELTHCALSHLEIPLWLEEGLTQLFEHDLGNKQFSLNPKEVAEQKSFWRSEGLEAFWSGEGFSSPGDVQKYSYQLAEILMRLLLTDYQPRWFGFDQTPVRALMNFIRFADRSDAGAAAAEDYLGLTLDEIAAKSLGRPIGQ
jgi:hypothetical protein